MTRRGCGGGGVACLVCSCGGRRHHSRRRVAAAALRPAHTLRPRRWRSERERRRARDAATQRGDARRRTRESPARPLAETQRCRRSSLPSRSRAPRRSSPRWRRPRARPSTARRRWWPSPSRTPTSSAGPSVRFRVRLILASTPAKQRRRADPHPPTPAKQRRRADPRPPRRLLGPLQPHRRGRLLGPRQRGHHRLPAPRRDQARPRRHPVHKSRFHGAFVLNRRVDLHAIDATPAR